ncbi:hypothetical protein MMAN_03550 [Mycobacterium mantenii]|uniref:Uncharacterized protein n=1 Tax=Mycobacterium mantenii TaxID=560555 RepID=A0ABM7JLA5_MYCNT|nr:hypothetical protein MMAN_03550 [Mycobacterium mantenii]
MRRRLTYRRHMCFWCADRAIAHSQAHERVAGGGVRAPRHRDRRNSAVRVGSPAARPDPALALPFVCGIGNLA